MKKSLVMLVVIIILGIGMYLLLGTQSASDTVSTDATAKMAPNALAALRNPMMVGMWQSRDDSKFLRTFEADGTVSDTYADDTSATDTGTWEVVDPAKEATGVPAENLKGLTVIRLNFQKAGAMFFSVNSLSDTDLTMSYLARGNMLSFTKVQ